MPEDADNLNLRERMELAALLPEHDPLRQKILQQIAADAQSAGKIPDHEVPAGREWPALLQETERLKLAMRSVPVPAGLQDRLLQVPGTAAPKVGPWWNRPLGELVTPRRLAIAASVILLIAAGWWAYVGIANWRERREFDRVASLAVDIHKSVSLRPPTEQIVTSDPKQAQAWLQSRVDFPAIMLSAPNTRLTSASVVRLGNAPAALTRWEKEGHAYTLMEFVPASVGLPPDFPQCTTEDPTPGPAGVPSKIVMWSEPFKGCGWVLVMDKNASNTFTY